MNNVWKIAWRNLGRNRKRSVVAATGIALGVGMCIGALGIMQGLSADLINGTTDGQVGHIQIHHPQYLAKHQLLDTVTDAAQLGEALRRIDGVHGVSARLYTWGYLSHGEKSVGIQLMGIDPEREADVTKIPRQLIQGAFVPSAPTPWDAPQKLTEEQQALDRALTERAIANAFEELEGLGSERAARTGADLTRQTLELVDQIAPPPQTPPPVVIGSKLARNLSAAIGHRLALLYENALGAQSSLTVTVAGISKTGTDLVDRTRTLIHIQDLQGMLLLDDQAHEIALRVADPRDAADAAAVLRGRLADVPLSVQSWSELRADILALIASNEALMGTLVFIVFLIAGLGVLNTMLVSVMERQKELSIMKALGFSPVTVTALVVLETVVLTVAATLAGLVIGLGLSLYLQYIGWDISDFGEFSLSGVGMANVLRAQVAATTLILPLVAMWVIAVFAALHPAIKAARVSPAVGMRAT